MQENGHNLSEEFQSSMRLINFILSILGSLIFFSMFAFYLYKIEFKKVEKQTKVILGFLMLFSVVQLVSNSIKFFM